MAADLEDATGVRALPAGDTAVPLVLEGFVVDSSGAAIEGAVVVTSAGGRTATGPDGGFRIEAGVSPNASAVLVGALSGTQLSGSVNVPTSGASSKLHVGTIELATSGCVPSWLPTFGSVPGTFGSPVTCFAVFDDGGGSELYAGGSFTTMTGTPVDRVAKWDGSTWSSLGSSATLDGRVNALAVFDDGNGPQLYAGGEFLNGIFTLNGMARWTGSIWSVVGPFGAGMNAPVEALEVFDDGSGSALYAGGQFTSAGGVPANRVAKWDGSTWSSLSSGANGAVETLWTHDDGTGTELFAGGFFTSVGGVAASRIAKWNGTSWSPLGTGTSGAVLSLTTFDDGSGSALYAGGSFATAGGVAASRVAKWDGATWAPLGTGCDSSVLALAVFDDGNGPRLYAGGGFTAAGGGSANRIAQWDGVAWAALDVGLSWTCEALITFDSGSGSRLFVGGGFSTAGNLTATGIATWDADGWSDFGGGLTSSVNALEVFDDGNGSALYAGGSFTVEGGAQSISRWDGSSWSSLGTPPNNGVIDLCAYDDGGGPELYVTGQFSTIGGIPVSGRIAKWDGTSWSTPGSGIGGSWIWDLAVFDDGTGPALYAGGWFATAGGVPASNIARWDGASWSPLGTGLNDRCWSLAVFDDGTGPALYAGGEFSLAGGVVANRIAKWDGASWSSLGNVQSGDVNALEVYDDGSGPALFAGGEFQQIGIVFTSRIAKWDGSSWSVLGSGLDGEVRSLEVFDDGAGPALYVGGVFSTAGGSAANRIARWDGAAWSPLGGGATSGGVSALQVFDDGSGPALFAGGSFVSVDSGDAFLGKWGCPSAPEFYCTAKTSSAGCVAVIGTTSSFAQPVSGAGDYSVIATGVQELKNGLLFVGNTGAAALPFNGGTLCTLPPLKRGPIQSSGGNAPAECDGSYATLVNDGLVLPLGLDAGPGNSAWYQYWYRDPQNGVGQLGTALSNGVRLDFE